MNMQNWMRALATHYTRSRERYPDERLLILFDIDGTILDMRYLVQFVLQGYDRAEGTSYFADLDIDRIAVHENHIAPLLAQLALPGAVQDDVQRWFRQVCWSPVAVAAAHRPLRGVLEVIRWFQLQPGTFVGLNSGRSEFLRAASVNALNALAAEYRVQFDESLVFLHDGSAADVPAAKVEAVERARAAGYRVVAMIDNEPDNLRAVAAADPNNEILLLHADTIFESRRESMPGRGLSGHHYDLTELVQPGSLPRHVQFVWHGVQTDSNLRQFLASDVHWAEIDVDVHPLNRQACVAPMHGLNGDDDPTERLLLDEVLVRLRDGDRGLKLDLRSGGTLVDKLLRALGRHGYQHDDLWFNGRIERLGEAGFRKLRRALPEAVVQCPVDFLVPLLLAAPQQAREVLAMLRGWGIDRLSLDWQSDHKRTVIGRLEDWGYAVNIYNVPDLESFLQAALLCPASVTSDFNFPKWRYHGLGGATDAASYRYALREIA